MKLFSSLRSFAIPALALVAAFAVSPPAHAQQAPITVFAAASLQNALNEAGTAFIAKTGTPVRFSFAATSALARQLEQAAPADLFASADLEWMDWVLQRNLVKKDTRVDLLGNKLVVVAPKDGPATVALTADGLKTALGSGRIAMGEVSAVPAGKYGKAALEKLGLWNSVSNQIAQVDNVRAALLLVSRKEAPLGVVYETDAKADANVKVVATFPADSHAPIIYPFAVTANSTNKAAGEFLNFLASAEAKPIFEKQGFTVLKANQ
jgi:molybdate transport system substrate-binding protein